jgi:hypothetical protein
MTMLFTGQLGIHLGLAALSMSHWPNTLPPVKSTDLTAGWVASAWVVARLSVTHRLTRLGSMPFSASTARIVRTVIAAGRMALLWA